MGNANSQIARPNSNIKAQSPDLVLGKQESLEPLENLDGASQGFVFSSQAPTSAHGREPLFPNQSQENHPISKFELPSSSPHLADSIKQESPSLHNQYPLQSPANSHHRRPSQESAITEEPTMSSPKPPKSRNRKSKKRSLSNQTSSTAPSAENADDKRLFISQSSMNLDASTSHLKTKDGADQLGGEERDEGESALNGASYHGDADELDARALRRQVKKERKRAKKAEKIRMALLEADPDFGNPTALAQAQSAQQITDDALESHFSSPTDRPIAIVKGTQDDTDPPKSSKKRKRRTETAVAAQPEPDVPSDDHDAGAEDPNQLPTPADEIHTTNDFGWSHGPDNASINAEEDQIGNDLGYHLPGGAVILDSDETTTAAVQSSLRKRKAMHSDKKSRKKRKQISEEYVNNSDMEDGEVENTASITAHSNQAQPPENNGTKPTSQSSLPTSVPKGPSGLGDFAQNLYVQRYNSQKSTPAKSIMVSTLSKLKPQDDSPSAARQHRRPQDRSVSSRLSSDNEAIQAEPVVPNEDEPDQEMDVNAELEKEVEVDNDDVANLDSDYVDGERSPGGQSDEQDEEMIDVDPDDSISQRKSGHAADVTMDDDETEELPPDIHGGQDPIEFDSDDLGALAGAEVEEQTDKFAKEPSEEVGNTIGQGYTHSTQKSSNSKRLRQYGSKTSTGRRRVAKPSFLDREEDNNAQAFAELPSPAAGAASRKNAKATVASSSTAQGKAKGKQLKISALLRGGSAEPFPTPTSIRNPRKIKDPPPSEATNGPFTGFELRNIDLAVQRWRVDKKLTEAQVNDMIHLNPQKSKTTDFWDHIQAAVPKRKRQKIINQCRRKYHNFVARGTWTQEQHDELAQAFEKHGPKYTLIANLINRHPEDVRDRVRNYVVCGKNRKTDTWDHEEERRLIAIMNEAFEKIREIQAEPGPDQAERQSKRAEDLVDWTLVSQNMNNTRSRLQCRTKWKALTDSMNGGSIDGEVGRSVDEIIERAREEADSMSHRDRYHIAKAVLKSGASADSRVPWTKLRASRVGQKWWRPTLMLVWYRLRHSIPDSSTMSIPELGRQICSSFQETGVMNFQDEEDMDLDAEYRYIEYKIGKILNNNRPKPKTPLLAIKSGESEDEEAEDHVEGIEEDEEGEPEPEQLDVADWDMSSMRDLAMSDNVRGASVDLGLDQSQRSDDREIDESVLGSPKTVKVKRNVGSTEGRKKGKRAAATNHPEKDVHDKVQDANDQVALSTADMSSKVASEPFEPNDTSPQRFKKASLKRRGANASSSATAKANAREGKGPTMKQLLTDEDKAASSDTDAEDVEDIPARL